MSTMATPSPIATVDRPTRRWQIAWGVLLIVLGFLAVLMPAVAALATALVFAWLLILAGACELANAMQTRRAKGFGWKLFAGLLTLALGIAIAVGPLAGVATLALLVGGFLLVSGVTRAMLAWRLRPAPGWGWVMFDGVLSIVLSILILVGWPATSLAIIGLLTGFSLLSAGFWRIALARTNAPEVSTARSQVGR
jgi:uncharacterized membrane protein HdeD (DUF308 family)